MTAQGHGSDVIGRDSVLDDATRFLDALAHGPAALLVEGHAGIGKTTVWRATAAAAAERDYRVISSTAVDGEADLPFVALRDLLEPVPAEAGAELPAPQRDALDVALLRSAHPDAVADQHAVCVAVLGVVRSLAAHAPLLIAVDDVGWMDRSSDRVLRYVIRRLTTEPVGILAARRPAVDLAVPLGLDGPPVGSRLGRVELGPLDPEALHVLITERHGLVLPRRTTRRIHDVCGGNPFAAVEIARAVERSGQRGVLSEAALPLPSGVLAVTAERIAALGPAARRASAVVATAATPTVALVEAAVGEQAQDGLRGGRRGRPAGGDRPGGAVRPPPAAFRGRGEPVRAGAAVACTASSPCSSRTPTSGPCTWPQARSAPTSRSRAHSRTRQRARSTGARRTPRRHWPHARSP